jgi:hypothetical protein
VWELHTNTRQTGQVDYFSLFVRGEPLEKPSIIERIDSVVTDTTFRNEQGQNLELERSNQVAINGKLIFSGKLFAGVPLSESWITTFQISFGLAADEFSQSFAGPKPAGFHNCPVISASNTTRWLLGVEDEALFAIGRSR